jgi:CheY-like chemotaxis protein
LLVEDEEIMGLFIREAISPLGLDLVAVSEAGQATEILGRKAIACAVIDVGLPGTRGDELTRNIRRQHPTLPIVLSTGYEPYDYQQEFSQDHWLRVLPKPYSEAQLLERLEDLRVFAGNGRRGDVRSLD